MRGTGSLFETWSEDSMYGTDHSQTVFFGLKTVVNQKRNDQCHAYYIQTKFLKSDLFLQGDGQLYLLRIVLKIVCFPENNVYDARVMKIFFIGKPNFLYFDKDNAPALEI